MFTKFRSNVSLGICFLFCAGAAWAQISAIEGEVKGTDGKPAQGAQILIEREDMKGKIGRAHV